MMVIKGMSYALNNPTKEILYQRTSSAIKFKCKSWIDTFGQRSAKAGGSLITNQFATSMIDLTKYVAHAGLLLNVDCCCAIFILCIIIAHVISSPFA